MYHERLYHGPPIHRLRTRRQHAGLHAAHGFFEADEQGIGNEAVADVELVDDRDRGDRSDVVERQPVSGIDDQAGGMRRAAPRHESAAARRRAPRAVGASA